ncbi:PREDICTED: transcriptional regulator ATRX homolog [Nicrophorus vespilloides]|uniref:Transcriptional regulator ATRX homolog n=1 Tax=Nicrophorus vespilloides TaxID=110193 RepID=A0ABM1MUX1_NICVS|nr:PREDICTED: transcriptional regulator ATRX homolog [Nicrophorus vespilloides]
MQEEWCTSLKTLIKDVSKLSTICGDIKSIEQTLTDSDQNGNKIDIINKTKQYILDLKETADKIYNTFNTDYDKWIQTEGNINVGKIKLVALSKLIDPLIVNNNSEHAEESDQDTSSIQENNQSEKTHSNETKNNTCDDDKEKISSSKRKSNETVAKIRSRVSRKSTRNLKSSSSTCSSEPEKQNKLNQTIAISDSDKESESTKRCNESTPTKCLTVHKKSNKFEPIGNNPDSDSNNSGSEKTNSTKDNTKSTSLSESTTEPADDNVHQSESTSLKKKTDTAVSTDTVQESENNTTVSKNDEVSKSKDKVTSKSSIDSEQVDNPKNEKSDGSSSSTYNESDSDSTKKRKEMESNINNILDKLVDSQSESSTDLELNNSDCVRSTKKRRTRKNKAAVASDIKDPKFQWKCFVPLDRIPAQELKANYMKKQGELELKRLSNMKTLKRTRRSGSTSTESTASSSSEKKKIVKRSRRKSSSSSSSSQKSDNDNETVQNNGEEIEVLIDKDVADFDDNDSNDLDHAIIDAIQDKDGSEESTSTDTEKSEPEKKKKEKTVDPSADENDKDKKKQSSWKRDKLLTEKLSESDDEDPFESIKKVREKIKKKQKRVISDSEESNANNDDSSKSSKSSDESEDEKKKKDDKKKRKRIKRVKDSSDDDDKSTRKHIRKVLNKDSLAETTKQAEKDEAERKARIAERQKKYNHIFDADKLENSSLNKVVLDFNEETNEELLAVDEELVKKLKPHQGKGVQFMWNACFESIDRAKNTTGSGCILAHCMGLGKTLQVITLIHTLLKNKEKSGIKKVLVVCPLSTVLNWVSEFKKWLPDDDEVEVYDLISSKQNRDRSSMTTTWHLNGGVLVIGYDMFRNLSNNANKRIPKNMRNDFKRNLVDPGPDMVVCDEGHLLKNEKTSLSISMNKLKTLRRIVLTGTPLQNNLKEYFCMVHFVKPSLLGTYKEYLNRFVNPITNGQYTDSTQHDIQIMRKRSHVLHKLLDGIVQRRDYSVLAPFLPPKHEYVLFVTLTETQINMYSHYMKEFAQKQNGGRMSFLFVDFQELQRICTHPRVVFDRSVKKRIEDEKKEWARDDESEGSIKDFLDDGSDSEISGNSSSSSSSKEEEEAPQQKSKFRRRTRAIAEAEGPLEEEVVDVEDSNRKGEWWSQYTTKDELDNIKYSGKLHLLFEILHQCEMLGDKILVFSQSLYSLNVIEYFLSKIDEASQSDEESDLYCGYKSSWSLGLDYFRLDGSSSCDNRAAWCKTFNDPENIRARLFLISTRAGGLGINLVAANRVIIFDVSWNPSHDIQSIYRVYRFGQTKPSYIYRFVTYGTMEMKIYERQVTKQAISKRVIDEQQIDRHYNQNDLNELYKFEIASEERPIPLVPKDILLGEMLQKLEKLIYKYHEHQTLLENKVDEVLNEEERKAAWDEFENEKKNRNMNNMIPGFAGLQSLPPQTIQTALISIIKKEQPSYTINEINGVMPQLLQELNSQMACGELTLYTKVVNELKMMQFQLQQQKLQEYYQQQQMLKMMQHQFKNSQNPNDALRMMQRWAPNNANPQSGESSTNNRPVTIDPEIVSIDD